MTRERLNTDDVNLCLSNPKLFPDQHRNNFELDNVIHQNPQRSATLAVHGVEAKRRESILNRFKQWRSSNKTPSKSSVYKYQPV